MALARNTVTNARVIPFEDLATCARVGIWGPAKDHYRWSSIVCLCCSLGDMRSDGWLMSGRLCSHSGDFCPVWIGCGVATMKWPLTGVLCFLGRWHSCPSMEGHSCFLAREVFTTFILADEGFAFVFESVKSFALVLRGNLVTSPWYQPKKLTMSIIFVIIVRTYTDCAYCVLVTVLRSSHA